jgi:hypothetical protein
MHALLTHALLEKKGGGSGGSLLAALVPGVCVSARADNLKAQQPPTRVAAACLLGANTRTVARCTRVRDITPCVRG